MAQIPDRVQSAIDNGYDFQFGQYISNGFNLFGKNAGLFIGYLLVYFAISLGLGLIPILGMIVSLMITGALVAGNYIVADKTARGEPVTFSNFFDGFQSWVPLFIVTLLTIVIVGALMIPFGAYMFTKIGFASLSYGERPDFGAIDILVFLLFFAAVLYLSVSLIYAALFVVMDKLDSWQAMMTSLKLVGKQFWMHLLFMFVMGLIIIISALPLGLGLLATIPAYYCAVYSAWADITDYHKEVAEDDDILRHLID